MDKQAVIDKSLALSEETAVALVRLRELECAARQIRKTLYYLQTEIGDMHRMLLSEEKPDDGGEGQN